MIVEGAILDDDARDANQGTVRFFVNDDLSVWGTVRTDWAERNARLGSGSRTIEVDVIDFASVLEEHGVPHYLKIDIEGCDMACVDALSRFRDRPDYLSIESDKTSFANVKREILALVELGYDRFQAVEQSSLPTRQSPPDPAREGAYVDHRFEEGSSGLFGSELGEEWKSPRAILRQYRVIRVGYLLLGHGGVMTSWEFRGASLLRRLTRRLLRAVTRASVPGWYDTHARHSAVTTRPSRQAGR